MHDLKLQSSENVPKQNPDIPKLTTNDVFIFRPYSIWERKNFYQTVFFTKIAKFQIYIQIKGLDPCMCIGGHF